MRVLRDYQREAVEAIDRSIKDGMTRPAIVMATGLGKTSVIGEKATTVAGDGGRVLAVAHRGKLLDQISGTCTEMAPHIPVGRVQAGRNETRRPITVASFQTLLSEKRRAQLLPRDARYDLIIIDEAHHAASPGYMRILTDLGGFDGVPTLGVTATMSREDKRGLGDVWEDVVFNRDIGWGIDHGWLVEPRGRAVVADHMDLNKAKISRGDYQDAEIGEMVTQDVAQIVTAWCEHADDRITAAFTPTVASGQALAAAFRDAGIAVGEVYGHMPEPARDRVYADLATGRIRVMVNVMVATEGWDCPPVSCILQCRPTRSRALYQQIVGRGLRPSAGKADCLVLDVVGASRQQSLVSLVDLHKSAKVNRDALDELPCEECGGYLPATVAAAAALAIDLEPCSCPTPERGEGPGRRQLIGPAEYEDVDMFTGSSCRWLWSRQGVRFLPAGERTFFLWPDYPDRDGERTTYSVASVVSAPWRHERAQWLADDAGHTLAVAREMAEREALALDPTVASRDAAWRRAKRKPSEKMVKLASRYGIANPEHYTAGALSDEISIVFASKRLEQGGQR